MSKEWKYDSGVGTRLFDVGIGSKAPFPGSSLREPPRTSQAGPAPNFAELFQTSDPKIPKTKDDTPSSRPSWPAENCRLPGFGGVQARYGRPRSAYSARGPPSPRPTRGVPGPSVQLKAPFDRPPRGVRRAAGPRYLLSCEPDLAPSADDAAAARSKTELFGLSSIND